LCTRNKWNTGRTGCFEKGDKPWNTGTKGVCKPNSGNFKSGQVSWNKKPVGYERICSKDGYVIVKVAEPNVFKLKHRIVWKKQTVLFLMVMWSHLKTWKKLTAVLRISFL
jgi:hypothetical protein